MTSMGNKAVSLEDFHLLRYQSLDFLETHQDMMVPLAALMFGDVESPTETWDGRTWLPDGAQQQLVNRWRMYSVDMEINFDDVESVQRFRECLNVVREVLMGEGFDRYVVE